MNEKLKLYFDFGNEDNETIEEEASFVYDEIKDLGIGEVEFEKVIDNCKTGKAIGDIIWTTLNIAVVTIAGIKPLLLMLENYLNRDERYSVRMKIGENEIDLKGATREERKKLIEEFLNSTTKDNNVQII